MPSCTPRPRSRTPRPSKNTLQQLNQTCRRQRSVAPASTRWNHTSPPAASPPRAKKRVDDVAPRNTTDRSREIMPRARRLPPSFPNKCNESPLRPRRQQDRASTQDLMPARCVSGTEASQKRNAATQHPHPTHPARQTRHESDGRVAPRPNAASQDHKFPQALRNSPRSALAPASTAHLLRGHHALLHVDNGFVEITINYARGGSAGFTSLHLNHNARRIPEETMMVSSTRLDVVVPQVP